MPRGRPAPKSWLANPELGVWVGDYRIIYEVDDRAKCVRVLRVRHRREVYR